MRNKNATPGARQVQIDGELWAALTKCVEDDKSLLGVRLLLHSIAWKWIQEQQAVQDAALRAERPGKN